MERGHGSKTRRPRKVLKSLERVYVLGDSNGRSNRQGSLGPAAFYSKSIQSYHGYIFKSEHVSVTYESDRQFIPSWDRSILSPPGGFDASLAEG
ncbi:hypothetical protein M407DRAFT_244227 [Tulasnella calospora MUT 4182]|uniref:Uncharacterized protein n=1 Tax=Tulasnella calospora MUT 4182 TaxID=1051891 RepID=A0A0C3LUD0_9AGAM|nr:hypothetical protein M407DRAFT_244227 [Tulasnella calospora MUT 4182]